MNLVSITADRLDLTEFDLFVTAIRETYKTVNLKEAEAEYRTYIQSRTFPRFVTRWCTKQNKILDRRGS